MPQVIVNPNNGLAESYEDPGQINQLLQEGYHVPLHDAEGNPFSAPPQEAASLVSTGQYRQPNPDELNQWLTTAKFQSPQEQAKTFIEGAAQGLAGPLATEAEMMLGVSPENIQARQALNPGTHLAGQISSAAIATAASGGLFGEAAAALAGGTLPGLIGKASQAAAKGISLTGTFGNLAKGMAQGAMEAGLYQVSHQLNENLIGNSDIFSEHAMADIGLSSLLGAGIGGAVGLGMGPFSKVAKQAEKVQGALERGAAKAGESAIRQGPFPNFPPPPGASLFEEPPIISKGNLLDALKKSLQNLDAGDFIHAFKSPASFAASQFAKLAHRFSTDKLIELFPEGAGKAAAILNTYKTGLRTLVNIENQSAGLFGYGAFQAAKPLISHKELEDIYDKTNEIGTDPNALVARMQQVTDPFAEHMPNTAISLTKGATNAIQYLAGQKPNLMPSAPLDREKIPSAFDIAKFNRTAALLNDPLSIYPKVKNGSITLQDVNTLKAVYPSVLQSIQKETLKNLMRYQSESKVPLPFQTRLGLSQLFGQNVDSSVTHLLKNQIALSGIRMTKALSTQPQPIARPSKSGMGRMKIGTRDQTRAQQSLERVST